MEKKEEIIKHIEDYFVSLYAREDWDGPSLDNVDFVVIMKEIALWLEREF